MPSNRKHDAIVGQKTFGELIKEAVATPTCDEGGHYSYKDAGVCVTGHIKKLWVCVCGKTLPHTNKVGQRLHKRVCVLAANGRHTK